MFFRELCFFFLKTFLLKVPNGWLFQSKFRKFSRETFEPEFRYSQTIGFAFRTNFAYESDTYSFMTLIMIL